MKFCIYDLKSKVMTTDHSQSKTWKSDDLLPYQNVVQKMLSESKCPKVTSRLAINLTYLNLSLYHKLIARQMIKVRPHEQLRHTVFYGRLPRRQISAPVIRLFEVRILPKNVPPYKFYMEGIPICVYTADKHTRARSLWIVFMITP